MHQPYWEKTCALASFTLNCTVELWNNEGPRDWQNLFGIILRFFLHTFYYYWGKEDRLLYQGICYIEVHFIKVLLHVTCELLVHWKNVCWICGLFHHRKTKYATLQHKDKGWENISNADYKGLGVLGFGQRVQIITTTGLQQNKIMYWGKIVNWKLQLTKEEIALSRPISAN